MQEIEIKLYLSHPNTLEERLRILNATVIQPRVLEVNLRFDTPNQELTTSKRVLRLRQDTAARLTFKGPGREQEGVRVRKEIEFEVSDFDSAREFLQALGYEISLVYEKYRAIFDFEGVHITLDELPYGYFAEIEGPDPASIHAACLRLGLDWNARINDSYTGLFNRLCKKKNYDLHDLTFENFKNIEVTPHDLGVQPADNLLFD